jgi:molybdopterin converting factor small subunit
VSTEIITLIVPEIKTCYTFRKGHRQKGDEMKFKVKLFATFMEHLPEGTGLEGLTVDMASGTTLEEVYARFNLPEKVQKITLVNGIHQKESYKVQEGDVISIFPPIAGG